MSNICEACGFDECDGGCTSYHEAVIQRLMNKIEVLQARSLDQCGEAHEYRVENERLKALLDSSCCHSHGEVYATIGLCEWCDAVREACGK